MKQFTDVKIKKCYSFSCELKSLLITTIENLFKTRIFTGLCTIGREHVFAAKFILK